MRRPCCVLVALLFSIGCGPPYRVAQISGRVTLDGKPLPKALVTFAPLGTKENTAPGPTAAGGTNEEGWYTVSIDQNNPGAVVGKCRVYITTVLSDPATVEDRDAGGAVRKRIKDKVPEKYNLKTELVFDVPTGGTDQANFDLRSK